MDKISELKRRLKLTVGSDPNLPIQAKIVSAEGETCTVELADGFQLSDVRLKATVSDGENYLILTPAEGSDVTLLSSDGTLKNLFVVLADDIEKFRFSHGGLKIEFDGTDGKVSIKNDSVSLYGLFDQLTNLLNGFTLNHPQGPTTGLMPPTMAAVQQFGISFKQLLKDN
jgi:hypothetical protein